MTLKEWILVCLDQAAEYDVHDQETYLDVIKALKEAVEHE